MSPVSFKNSVTYKQFVYKLYKQGAEANYGIFFFVQFFLKAVNLNFDD